MTLNRSQTQIKQAVGIFAIVLSALFFYWSTFIIKKGVEYKEVSGIPFVVSRFFLGYIFLALFNIKISVAKKDFFWLRSRAIWNTIAVVFFFLSVEYSGVTISNVLNMTYPIFVALLAPYFIGEENGYLSIAGIVLAFLGSYLIIAPKDGIHLHFFDLLGLLSGLTGGIAILSLRRIRQSASTGTILLYTFRIGSILSIPLGIFAYIRNPEPFLEPAFHYYLWSSAALGFGGQILLTYGFRYVSAIQGSIISSTRILMAVLFGLLFLDHELTVVGVLGGLAVFAANILVNFDKKVGLKKIAQNDLFDDR